LYIGIGAETNIHPIHIELLKLSKLVAIRSKNLKDIFKINPNTIHIPDLVYSLKNDIKSERKEKSVLILPNIHTVPQWLDPYWKHTTWNHFKVEFAQFLDYLIDNAYNIDMFPMSTSVNENDKYAAYEIINHMKYRNNYIVNVIYDNIIKLFSQYDMIITQRYHGMILSELARVPYLSIAHHDKLRNTSLSEGVFIDYYTISKDTFIKAFNKTISLKLNSKLPIDRHSFRTLKQKVNKILNE
jgi:polysaccharide pyruvyl transferase WcaK-like protein